MRIGADCGAACRAPSRRSPPGTPPRRHVRMPEGCQVTGGLRKRAHSYLNVPSATVTDGRLSFKARGILAYLLDKPAGWDVRSVAIAADSPDGKAAVQAGLRELARAGYYRIERRRLLDGRLVTGTAVSEEPVASWASEYAEYQGPVPVVQQPDGSFKVQHKDGSLTGDGFTDDPGPEPLDAEPASDGDDSVSAARTGTQFSGPGSAGAGQTGAGSAGAGKPGAFINAEELLQKTSPLPPGPIPARCRSRRSTGGGGHGSGFRPGTGLPGHRGPPDPARVVVPIDPPRAGPPGCHRARLGPRPAGDARRRRRSRVASARPTRSRRPVVEPPTTRAARPRAATVVRSLRRSYATSGLRPRRAASMPSLPSAGEGGFVIIGVAAGTWPAQEAKPARQAPYRAVTAARPSR